MRNMRGVHRLKLATGLSYRKFSETTGVDRTQALGASNFTCAEALWSETPPDWIGAHAKAFSATGGVPKALVPDSLKAGTPSRHTTSRASTVPIRITGVLASGSTCLLARCLRLMGEVWGHGHDARRGRARLPRRSRGVLVGAGL